MNQYLLWDLCLKLSSQPTFVGWDESLSNTSPMSLPVPVVPVPNSINLSIT